MAPKDEGRNPAMTGRTQPSAASGSNALNGLMSGGTNMPGGAAFAGMVYLGGGVYQVETAPVFNANQYYLQFPEIEKRFNSALRKYGFGDVNPATGQQYWEMAVKGAADLWQKSGGRRQITPEQYLAWSAKTTGGQKKPAVSRQVYMSDPATVRELINTTVENTLGRKATKAEMDDFYGAIQKMMQEGTVTTSKTRVRNGIPETVTTQKQGFSQAKAEQLIEKRLGQTAQEDVAQKKSLDFIDFLFGGVQ